MAKLSDFAGMNPRGGKIVFISYNSVEGLKSGSYAGDRVVILANDAGRAFLITETNTIDQKMDEKTEYDSAAVTTELELLGIDPKKATKEQRLEALRSYADRTPGLRDEIVAEKELKDRRAQRVMDGIAALAEKISAGAGLVVIYAGLHAFEQAVALAKQIRSKGIGVAILSCSCRIGEKRSLLKGTDIQLLDCECSGEDTMGMLAKLFIADFQSEEITTETIQ